jgi:DNA-binding MarR family transcriptional regulator
MLLVDAARLERRRATAVKARGRQDRHPYFFGVAQARYLLRKVFRLVEEQARRAGIDPLEHQALIQIYGSETGALKVREVAERLDITPAFASSLIQTLASKGLVMRSRDADDQRVMWIKVTGKGKTILYSVDEQVQAQVDRFTRGLPENRTEAAISILMFYAGVSLKRAAQPGAQAGNSVSAQRLATIRKPHRDNVKPPGRRQK